MKILILFCKPFVHVACFELNLLDFFLFLSQEITLIILFVIEYIIRLWAVGCRSAYVGIKGRLRFAVQIYSIIGMLEEWISFYIGVDGHLCQKSSLYSVCTGHGKPGKSWNWRISFSRPGRSLNLIVGPWKSWKMKGVFGRLITADGKARKS